jgi:IMP dehydrogenase/GMP reductase
MINKFDFDDILLQPAAVSTITTRSMIDIEYPQTYLPIIAAPMDTVVSETNYFSFLNVGINVCIPRGMNISDRLVQLSEGRIWKSLSFQEFKDLVVNSKEKYTANYILIDMANGHIEDLAINITLAKKRYGNDLKIMAGNIANPETYVTLSKAGADYVRIGIGNGNACLTTQQTAIGYPLASLIVECYKLKIDNKLESKIVADGGMKKYSDIIKALALGADYVMVGSLLNKCLESAGTAYFKGFKISSSIAMFLYKRGFKLKKKFRGMSTKEVQKDWGKTKLTTSEGIIAQRYVETDVKNWTENFKDYIKSSMSYCNARNLSEFIGKAKWNYITTASLERFKK